MPFDTGRITRDGSTVYGLDARSEGHVGAEAVLDVVASPTRFEYPSLVPPAVETKVDDWSARGCL